MFCLWCTEEAKFTSAARCNFTEGCENAKKDSVLKHESSNNIHRKIAAEKVAKVLEMKGKGSEASRAKQLMADKTRDISYNKVRNAHFLAKHNLSFLMFADLCELDKAKGVAMNDYKKPVLGLWKLLTQLLM